MVVKSEWLAIGVNPLNSSLEPVSLGAFSAHNFRNLRISRKCSGTHTLMLSKGGVHPLVVIDCCFTYEQGINNGEIRANRTPRNLNTLLL